MAGTRGGTSDGADAKQVAELTAQVSYLEEEVSVLRRKLSDSPRTVRALFMAQTLFVLLVTVRLGRSVCLGPSPAWCLRAACDSSGDWPHCVPWE